MGSKAVQVLVILGVVSFNIVPARSSEKWECKNMFFEYDKTRIDRSSILTKSASNPQSAVRSFELPNLRTGEYNPICQVNETLDTYAPTTDAKDYKVPEELLWMLLPGKPKKKELRQFKIQQLEEFGFEPDEIVKIKELIGSPTIQSTVFRILYDRLQRTNEFPSGPALCYYRCILKKPEKTPENL